ncbi:MAG: hypothetical protein ACR2PK_19935 [Acidimicrobiales bacterium]
METNGIPAVSVFIRSFAHIPALMGLSRVLVVDHPLGRQLGAPGDHNRQIEVVSAALELLDANEQSAVDFGLPYRPSA